MRQRIQDLRRNTLASEMPYNDPHTADCRLWSNRYAERHEYECSAAAIDLSTPVRLSLECFLIWRYRIEAKQSTLCNFGRLHPQYSPSRNRSTGIRGQRLPDGQHRNEFCAPSVLALPLNGTPTDQDWMTLGWTPLRSLSSGALTDMPASPGVYKLIDDTGRLLYVGESASLCQRLMSHRKRSWGECNVLFSFCSLPQMTIACQRLEIENDLLAGYYTTSKKAPTFQFGIQ